ncbi:MAG: type II toxin-antitoxin system Phd/YefM family antitoxin [Dehalococcoidia bacterium]
MKTVPAGEFKAKCLKLMQEVSQSGEPLLVTKRGKPLVRVSPECGDTDPAQRDRELEREILAQLKGSVLWEAPDAWEPDEDIHGDYDRRTVDDPFGLDSEPGG